MTLRRKLGYAAILMILAGCTPPDDSDIVGSPAADFQVSSAKDNRLVALKDMRGKVVLIDFWATYCGPCKAITPYMEAIYQKYHAQGLEAMAISPEPKATVSSFEKRTPHTMPVYLDPNLLANNALKVPGFPTIALIGRDGTILYYAVGLPQSGPQPVADDLTKAVANAFSGT